LTGWTNLSWLPDPTESDWTALLKPGFGREGAVLTDSEHAFAPFVAQLVQRFGYRVAADEDALAACKGGHVFARSSGGAAIGFELALGGGRVIVVPAINKPERDREQIAAALLDSFERMAGVATNDKVNESTGVN
jgi:hypothetical protein